jgi:hypothetical protein
MSERPSQAEIDEANSSYIHELEEQLEASKQRELELLAVIYSLPVAVRNVDFTALREYRVRVLLDAADLFDEMFCGNAPEAKILRRMAEERSK